jgi:hypothetical protein
MAAGVWFDGSDYVLPTYEIRRWQYFVTSLDASSVQRLISPHVEHVGSIEVASVSCCLVSKSFRLPLNNG